MPKKIRMLSPVVCTHCGAIYDLCAVVPICRYADCTTFKTPCCNCFADDRKWKSLPDIRPVLKTYQCVISDGTVFRSMDNQGRIRSIKLIDPDPDGSKYSSSDDPE